MAGVKISALPSAGALAGTEEVPGVQSGSTVKMTVQNIADLAGGGGDVSIALKDTGSLAGVDSLKLFTVTGLVKFTVVATVTEQLTCTGGASVVNVGDLGRQIAVLSATVNNTIFTAGSVWPPGETNPNLPLDTFSTNEYTSFNGDIYFTSDVDDLTAGRLDVYALWTPISVGATVVAA